jgi:hypothetical protein
MIPDKILKNCYCSLEDNTHFLNEPLVLPCGHTACKKCIDTNDELKCNKCQTINKKDANFPKSSTSEDLIEMYVEDLLLKVEERFKISFESFKSKFF